MEGESSARTKLLAKGLFGRGPRQPAREKEAPLFEVISVGPGRTSLVVEEDGTSVVDSTGVEDGAGGVAIELLLLLITRIGVVEKNGGGLVVEIGDGDGDGDCETGAELLSGRDSTVEVATVIGGEVADPALIVEVDGGGAIMEKVEDEAAKSDDEA